MDRAPFSRYTHVGEGATLVAVYFGLTLVALAFIGVDWLAGTSLMRGPDWVLPVKLAVLAAMLLWGLLIFAPAATLSWALDARTLLQRTVACRYWIRRRRVGSWYTRQIGAACPLSEVEETSGCALINGLLWSLRDPTLP